MERGDSILQGLALDLKFLVFLPDQAPNGGGFAKVLLSSLDIVLKKCAFREFRGLLSLD